MGINGNLKQISFKLLEKLQKHPDFISLFWYAEWLPDSDYWQKYQQPGVPHAVLEMLAQQQNLVTETLQELENKNPEEYENMRGYIPLILEEGKELGLELDSEWHILSFLLTGHEEMGILPFLIENNCEDNLLAVNAILCGTETRCESTYGFYRYLVPNEVKQITEALNTFPQENIIKRFNRGMSNEPDIYKFHWTEEDLDFTLTFYKKLVDYYNKTNENGNAMLLYLT